MLAMSAPSSRRRSHNAGGHSRMAKVAEPPACIQACAKARQRITWPVPIEGEASVRSRSSIGLAHLPLGPSVHREQGGLGVEQGDDLAEIERALAGREALVEPAGQV